MVGVVSRPMLGMTGPACAAVTVPGDDTAELIGDRVGEPQEPVETGDRAGHHSDRSAVRHGDSIRFRNRYLTHVAGYAAAARRSVASNSPCTLWSQRGSSRAALSAGSAFLIFAAALIVIAIVTNAPSAIFIGLPLVAIASAFGYRGLRRNRL